VYHSVLSGISEAFAEVEKRASSETSAIPPFSTHGPIFSDIVSCRLKIVQRFGDQTKVSLRGCDNPKVSFVSLSPGRD
jgi:hypothetical protein